MPPAKKTAASRATPTAQNRQQQARPGDATGAERDRLTAENAAAQKEAAQRMSLITSPPVVERTDQVVDYTQGGSANVGFEPDASMTMEDAIADGTAVSAYDLPESQLDLDALPDGKTDILPEMLENPKEPQPLAGQRRDSQQPQAGQPYDSGAITPDRVIERVAPVVEEAHRIMRVNTDLEDITIGKDNHYTFRVGVPYKVPAPVYNHLSEKGYVMA